MNKTVSMSMSEYIKDVQTRKSYYEKEIEDCKNEIAKLDEILNLYMPDMEP